MISIFSMSPGRYPVDQTEPGPVCIVFCYLTHTAQASWLRTGQDLTWFQQQERKHLYEDLEILRTKGRSMEVLQTTYLQTQSCAQGSTSCVRSVKLLTPVQLFLVEHNNLAEFMANTAGYVCKCTGKSIFGWMSSVCMWTAELCMLALKWRLSLLTGKLACHYCILFWYVQDVAYQRKCR